MVTSWSQNTNYIKNIFIELNHKGRRNFQKYNKINKKKALIFRLGPFKFGAGNETRTRDPNLGKVMLYQLSYSRMYEQFLLKLSQKNQSGAGNETRTRDPNLGKVMLYQLSYSRVPLIIH